MLVSNGAAIEGGTLINVLKHREVQCCDYGRQGCSKVGCVHKWSLCTCVCVCVVCVCTCVCVCVCV